VSKLLHPSKWKACISEAVALFNYLRIKQYAIFQEHISQCAPLLPAVLVSPWGICRVKLQSHTLAFHHTPSECGSFSAIELNRLFRVLGLGSINTDETQTLAIIHNQRIAIDYTLHDTVSTVNRSNAVGNATAERAGLAVRKSETIKAASLRERQRGWMRLVIPQVYSVRRKNPSSGMSGFTAVVASDYAALTANVLCQGGRKKSPRPLRPTSSPNIG
jgi:hypothetical protein